MRRINFVLEFSRLVLPVVLLAAGAASAQTAPAAAAARPAVPDGVVILDVSVKDAAGKPVEGLKASDFTLTDDGKSISPFAFTTLEGDKAPVEAIVVLDALALDRVQIALAKDEIEKFLRGNGGKLNHPVALGWLQKEKTSPIKGGVAVTRPVSGGAGYFSFMPYSRDGNAMAAEFDKSFIGDAPILYAQGGDGAAERTQITLDSIALLTDIEMTVPGRKLLYWVGVELTPTASSNGPGREKLFRSGVYFQDQLRRSRMSMSLISAIGGPTAFVQAGRGAQRPNLITPGTAGPATTEDVNDHGSDRSGNAPRNASEARAITLQALSKRTGGVVLAGGNPVSVQLAKGLAEADSSYALGYRPPASTAANEYHADAVTVDTPGAKVRTSLGYYWGVSLKGN